MHSVGGRADGRTLQAESTKRETSECLRWRIEVSPDALLGEPGRGMQVAGDVLSASRLSTAAVALGAAQRAAQLMLRYVSRREIETGKLIDNPQTTSRMSEFSHRTALAMELLDWCARELDDGRPLPAEIAMAVKVSATDTLNFGADLLVQLLGGRGYMENNIAPQLFRDARMLSIGEGPNEGLVAAIGRWVRLQEGLAGFLAERIRDEEILNEFSGLESRILENVPASGEASQETLIRKDVLLGRAVLAVLDLHAGRTLHAREGEGHAETQTWARLNLQLLLDEIGVQDRKREPVLDGSRLAERIGTYRSLIGDLEPLAPEVEYTLDPLLRREPPSSQPIEKKRELLRKLLEREKQGENPG